MGVCRRGGQRALARPADETRSGRYNLRQLARWRAERGITQPLDRLVGGGTLTILNGRLHWTNFGYGRVRIETGTETPVVWAEYVSGKHERAHHHAHAAPAEAPTAPAEAPPAPAEAPPAGGG